MVFVINLGNDLLANMSFFLRKDQAGSNIDPQAQLNSYTHIFYMLNTSSQLIRAEPFGPYIH